MKLLRFVYFDVSKRNLTWLMLHLSFSWVGAQVKNLHWRHTNANLRSFKKEKNAFCKFLLFGFGRLNDVCSLQLILLKTSQSISNVIWSLGWTLTELRGKKAVKHDSNMKCCDSPSLSNEFDCLWCSIGNENYFTFFPLKFILIDWHLLNRSLLDIKTGTQIQTVFTSSC